MSNWRGCKNIEFIDNGSWSDPELVWNGYTFNYWDIEGALWDEYLEYNGYTESDVYDDRLNRVRPEYEDEFDKYCQEYAEDYLEDVIDGGYFKNGSKDWKDDYKKESKRTYGTDYNKTPYFEVDMDKFVKEFKTEYKYLYDRHDKVAGYYDAMMWTERFMSKAINNESYRQFIKDFAKVTGDAITSDREYAAFAFACENLGLFKEIGKYIKVF